MRVIDKIAAACGMPYALLMLAAVARAAPETLSTDPLLVRGGGSPGDLQPHKRAEDDVWKLLLAKASNHTARRRTQANFGAIGAAGPNGAAAAGVATDAPIPVAHFDGVFVLDLERHVAMGSGVGNITGEHAPGLGLFANRVSITFDSGFNGSKPDDSAIIQQGNGERVTVETLVNQRKHNEARARASTSK